MKYSLSYQTYFDNPIILSNKPLTYYSYPNLTDEHTQIVVNDKICQKIHLNKSTT